MITSKPTGRHQKSFLSLFLSTLESIYNETLLILNYISVVCIFIVSLWIFSDVVGRYFFNHPIPGTTEIVKCMIIIIVFLGIAYTFQKERHIRTVLILDRLRPALKRWVEIIACLIGVAVFTLLCITSIEAAWDSIAAGEYDGVQVRVPVYPSRLTVALGSGLLVIQAILNLFKQLASMGRLRKKEE
jgi:TRAP-type C4-dicarboxylate transport system permease small subunit